MNSIKETNQIFIDNKKEFFDNLKSFLNYTEEILSDDLTNTHKNKERKVVINEYMQSFNLSLKKINYSLSEKERITASDSKKAEIVS